VRRVRPRHGGEWHRRQMATPEGTPARTTERFELRQGLQEVKYKETRDRVAMTDMLARRKRRMRNGMVVGERLRQWQHSAGPATAGPREAQPEGVT
jgi:hypothetical protein